jgi:hypothetical protein
MFELHANRAPAYLQLHGGIVDSFISSLVRYPTFDDDISR